VLPPLFEVTARGGQSVDADALKPCRFSRLPAAATMASLPIHEGRAEIAPSSSSSSFVREAGIEGARRHGEPGDTRENQRRLKAFLLDYISEGHGRDAENGCVMPSLSADVGRAGDQVRKTYQKRMRLLIDCMTQAMTGADGQRRKRAWVVLALMVGTITVARALPDGPERRELLVAALANALKTAEL